MPSTPVLIFFRVLQACVARCNVALAVGVGRAAAGDSDDGGVSGGGGAASAGGNDEASAGGSDEESDRSTGCALEAMAVAMNKGTESFLREMMKERARERLQMEKDHALDRQHQLAVLQARGGGTVARGGAGSADIAGEKYRGGGDPSGIMEGDAEVRAVNAVSGGGGGRGGGGGDGLAPLAALILAGQEMMQAAQEKTLGARACARAGVLCARSVARCCEGAVNELCGVLKDLKRHRDEDDGGTDGNGGGRPRLRPRISK